MPAKSKAQMRFLWAKKPKLAKEFAEKTKSIKALPEHVKKPKAKGARKTASKRGKPK